MWIECTNRANAVENYLAESVGGNVCGSAESVH